MIVADCVRTYGWVSTFAMLIYAPACPCMYVYAQTWNMYSCIMNYRYNCISKCDVVGIGVRDSGWCVLSDGALTMRSHSSSAHLCSLSFLLTISGIQQLMYTWKYMFIRSEWWVEWGGMSLWVRMWWSSSLRHPFFPPPSLFLSLSPRHLRSQ